MTATHAQPEQTTPIVRRRMKPGPVSRRLVTLSLLASFVIPGTGCRLCCDLEDAAYPAYGGAWERTDRDSGRVGSLFDPAGARAADLVPRESAGDKSDALERIAPGLKARPDRLKDDPSLERTIPERKSEEETEQEFQERLRKFKEESEALLNAGVIPGPPLPPARR